MASSIRPAASMFFAESATLAVSEATNSSGISKTLEVRVSVMRVSVSI